MCPDEKVLVFQAFITSQIHGYKLMTLADKYVGGVGDITLWVGVVFLCRYYICLWQEISPFMHIFLKISIYVRVNTFWLQLCQN